MQKKILIAISCLTLSLNLAQASPYFGLSSGVVVNTSDDVGVYGNEAGNYRGIPLTLSAGYGVDLRGSFYIAGELFFTPTIGELNSSYGNYLKTTYGYGVSLLPGIQLSEHTIGYARIGWIGTHFENQSSNANGAQFGLGLKTSVTQNWDVRIEYSIAGYEIDKNASRWNPYGSGTSSVRADQFSLGVVYRFI